MALVAPCAQKMLGRLFGCAAMMQPMFVADDAWFIFLKTEGMGPVSRGFANRNIHVSNKLRHGLSAVGYLYMETF